MDCDVVEPEQLSGLSQTSHYVAELLNVSVDPDQAYVGKNAFAHKGGMHVAGIATDARTFEHLEPEQVGNTRSVLPSELSGKATVLARAKEIDLQLDDAAATEAITRLKGREHEGYHYEAAEASFDLLLRRCAGEHEPLFRLEGFRVLTEMREDGTVSTEATLRIWVGDERHLSVAEGNGPVNALDQALRSAITSHYPHLADIELTGYRVRILDSDHGTGARTRVLLDSSDGESSWGSIGVSENIIEASWEALVDSLEYAFPRENGTSVNERLPWPVPTSGPRRNCSCSRCCDRAGSHSARCSSASNGPSPSGSGLTTRSPQAAGRRALHLGVRALGWGGGDEVVLSPFTFVASANCLIYEGIRPVFADVDPVTLNLDPAGAEAALGRATVGLLPIDIFGYPSDMPAFEQIAADPAVWACSRTQPRHSERSTLRAGRSAAAATSPPSRSTPTSR